MTPQESRDENGSETSTEQGKYQHLKRETERRGRGTNKAEKRKQFLKSMKDTEERGAPGSQENVFKRRGN